MIFPTKITTNWDHTIPNHPDVPKENHQKRHSISDAADLGRRCPAPASTVVAKDSADEERTMRSSWTPKKNVGITGASILISQIDYHVYDLTWYIYIYNWYTNIDMSVFIIVMMLIWDMYTCVYIYMLSEIKCDEIMIIYWNKSWQIAEIKASSYLNIIYICDCPGYAKKVYVIQLYIW